MDARLKRYYQKKMSGGRSVIARITDFVMLRAAILIVVFILMLQWSHSLKVSIPVAVLIAVAFSVAMILYKRKKADNFLKKDMQRIREKCLLESLTLMNSSEYMEYMKKLLPNMIHFEDMPGGFIANLNNFKLAILHNHPSGDCDVAQTVNIYRLCKDAKKVAIISLSAFTGDAEKFAENAGVELIPGKEVLKLADKKGMLPDQQSAEERAKQEMESSIVSMERIKHSALNRTKVKAYVFCGLATMLWPLISGWRFYYPIISVLCFALAFLSFKRDKHTQESSDIDLT